MSDQPVKSSMIESVSYDGKGLMKVKFVKGAEYEYPDVKPELYNEFSSTFQTDASTGKFFAKNIRHLKNRKVGK